ncbi:YybS family protein [Sutcliffiella halmapala]|uniref:YybS family protein n=1 Tax=Sutcliffiella halmapala TaxID=79882 RepID=UPI001472C08E|nr:YybS family protein [Sutcliffiella halmapala]
MKTKNITEGAVLLGVFILLLLVTLFIPFVGLVTLCGLIIPFVIYTIRNGWKSGLWFIVIANLLSMLFFTPVILLLCIPVSTAGVVMGYFFSKNSNRYAVLGAGTGVYLLNLLLGYIVTIVIFNIDIMEMVKESAEQSVISAELLASTLGKQNAEEAMEQVQQTMDGFIYLMPSFLVTIAFVFAFISQWVSVIVLKRLKIEVNAFPPFRELVLPKSLLWYYLIVLLLSLSLPEEGTTLYLAIVNLSFILMLLMTIQGLSFLFFICYEKKIPKAIPIMVLIFSFLLSPLLYIIRMIGIIDIGFNLRKRINSKK